MLNGRTSRFIRIVSPDPVHHDGGDGSLDNYEYKPDSEPAGRGESQFSKAGVHAGLSSVEA